MNWPLVQLGGVADISAGNSAPQGQHDFSEEGIPFVRAGSLSDLLKGETSHLERIAEDDAKRLKLRLFSKNSILFAKSGMSCMKGYVYRLPFEAYVVSHLAIVQPGPELYPAYAEHALRVFSPVSLVRDEAYPSIRLPDISAHKVPLPPLDEQRRIAAILDQADALRRLRSRALDKLNTLGQAIFHEMFGDVLVNPKGLPRAPLASVATFTSGATPSKSESAFWENGDIPWITPKDMKAYELVDAIDKVTHEAVSKTNLKIIPSDTPLIVVRGMILAHTVPIGITKIQCTINQDMKAIRFSDEILPEFGMSCLIAQHSRLLKRVDTAAHGTKRLNMDRLGETPILMPSISEQREFLTVLATSRAAITSNRLAKEKELRLFSSLQHRAFKGEL